MENKRIRNRKGLAIGKAKGLAKGLAVGKTKGTADYNKWVELGRPTKSIKIPVNTDIELITEESNKLNLIPDYTLFLLYKILYNRQTCYKEDRSTEWFKQGYSPLYSQDLIKWIGTKYVKYINLLIDLNYIHPLRNDKGNVKYCTNEITARYRINTNLLNLNNPKSKIEKYRNFKLYQLNNLKLINKLNIKQRINNEIRLIKESHQLLANKVHSVKFNIDKAVEWLDTHYIKYPVADLISFMDTINSGEIYVKRDLDTYGERFHSSFTFSWSVLRQFMYFENTDDSVSYSDVKNSQFYFLSILNADTIKLLLPNFSFLVPLLNKVINKEDYKEFIKLCQNGTVYETIAKYYVSVNNEDFLKLGKKAQRKLAKSILMKVVFSGKKEYLNHKKQLHNLFPSLIELVADVNNNFDTNLIPKVLQLLESTILLDKVAVKLILDYDIQNLITIHDGFIYSTSDNLLVNKVIRLVFEELNLPVPELDSKKFQFQN